MDLPTLQTWLEKLGYEAVLHGKSSIRLRPRPIEGAPPETRSRPGFYVQCGEHWVMLSMLPMLGPDDPRPDNLLRRLLAANREMRVAKYAVDKNSEIVLCAELPTESLDFPELADALERIRQYAEMFRTELLVG